MAIVERTLTVRPASPADAASVTPWLADALATAVSRDEATPTAEALIARIAVGDAAVQVIEAEGEPAGVIVLEREAGDVRFSTVTVRREERGRGLAAKAIVDIEASLDPAPARLLVPVAPRDGRLLYFWLRLGYRPILVGGRMVMERPQAAVRRASQ